MSPLPYARLAGFSRLFRDYAAGDGPARPGGSPARAFFASDPYDPAARASAAAVAAVHPRDRRALVDVLAEQHRAWDAPEAVHRNRERLLGPESAAVVTGQQLGLFGGPLYTVYKAVTAVQLARRLERETGRAVVPVFWLADEDHDWDEVRVADLPRGGNVVRIELPGDEARPPVGHRVLEAAEVERALRAVEEVLPPTAHTPALVAQLREAYRPGRTHRDAFARLLLGWLGPAGLVVMSADDTRLKRLGAGLFGREVRCWAETLEALETRSAELEAAGYHAQLAPSPVNLFLLDGGARLPIDPADGGGFAARGTDRRLSEADLLALLEHAPERVSPNAALRPLYQDTLLPTAAYVAGPGEVAYYAQLQPVYTAFGVPMPVIVPRASVTLLPARAARALDAFGLELPDLQGDIAALHRRLALGETDEDVDGAFGRARGEVEAVAARLAETTAAVDPTLGRAGGALGAALAREVERLHAKTVRAAKRQHAETGRRLAEAQACLAPSGGLQERTLSPLVALNARGPAWLDGLPDALSLDTAAHQVLPL